MAICKNCGKPLILSGGKCIYCQHRLDGLNKQDKENSNQYKKVYSSNREISDNRIRARDIASSNNQRKGKFIRYILFAILLLEIVSVTIVVYSNDAGSGYSAYAMVIVFSLILLMASDRMYDANKGEYAQCKRGRRLYHEFFHFFVKMIAVILVFLIVMNFHNYWGWILLILLALSIIFLDCVICKNN